jgi:aspartyl-tRNA(Asn)/glutamyl-tRNA(Gln) amidotransferase subunit A
MRRLSAAFLAGSVSPVAVTKQYLARIETLGRRLNAFITVLQDTALKASAESERRYKAGTPLGPLDGVPIAVKDIFYISGVRCTAGSKVLAENVATYDAPVVKYLRDAGAVLVGTTNLHEFAAGVTSSNPHYGNVKNPWDESRVAGGSSGGSAVAVSTGMAEGAIGTDTAGSVRIPAALCGIVGFKPTYGRVSRLGVVPLASSLDTVGILSLCAWDTAAMLQTMVRHDKNDMTTADEPVPNYTDSLLAQFSGARVGAVREYFRDTLDPRVEENFVAFASRLRQIGCSVEDTDLEGVQEVCDRWVLIRQAEATAFHLRWLESSPELYGDDVRKLMEQGKSVLAVDYVNALNTRPAVIERFSDVMRRFDFLLVPSTCIPAPGIGQANVTINGKEVTTYSALNRLTLPFNYVGLPAISIPSGMVGCLPLGVQLVGRLFDEAAVLRVVHAYEEKFGPFPLPSLHEQILPTG